MEGASSVNPRHMGVNIRQMGGLSARWNPPGKATNKKNSKRTEIAYFDTSLEKLQKGQRRKQDSNKRSCINTKHNHQAIATKAEAKENHK
ncbi:hypothetical protein GBA52_010586 [Prunus armeniaca]|nr:hypothetical protein GBA52_010586 [Prunus armeniaca]